MATKKTERSLRLNAELELLQQEQLPRKWRRLLIVLQAMDTGGKDGAIQAVLGVN